MVQVLQVVAVGHVSGAELRLVTDQQDAGAVRAEEALVRVPRDRVGLVDAPQERAAFGQLEGAAVRAVDVDPQGFPVRERADLVERVDDAGAGRTGRADDQERAQAVGSVVFDHGSRGFDVHAQVCVGGDDTDAFGGETRDVGGLRDAVVRVLGDVDRSVGVVGLQPVLTGRVDRRERVASDARS